jgi:hypothetical protein
VLPGEERTRAGRLWRHDKQYSNILPYLCFITEGADLSRWTTDEIESVAATLNNRPRKTQFYRWLRTSLNGVVVPRYAPNKMPTLVKKRYFELIRSGMKGAAAARVVGVSTSCGSLWFLETDAVIITSLGRSHRGSSPRTTGSPSSRRSRNNPPTR